MSLPIDSAAWVADFQIRDRSPRSQFRYVKKPGSESLPAFIFVGDQHLR